jgi:hypothetical protein
MTRRRTRALVLVAAIATTAVASVTLAGADEPKGPKGPIPTRPLPPAAQAALDARRGPDGRIDVGQLRLPMRGPDGQLQRNPDGSVKLFDVNDLPDPLPPVRP